MTTQGTVGLPAHEPAHPVIFARLVCLTTLAMCAFAANSLLCRHALSPAGLDPATFSTVRLISGAAVLWLLLRWKNSASVGQGSWLGAFALFIYVAGFSFAYLWLPAGVGALLLFGAVQLTMITAGLFDGERLRTSQTAGLIAALSGLGILVLPGVDTPTPAGSLLMLASGVAWGVYSLAGRGATDPVAATAENFMRAVPLTLGMSAMALPWLHLDMRGVIYAVLSGAVASAMGYVLWYAVLPELKVITASSVQLSVPVLAAAGGIVWLEETLTPVFVASSALILVGVRMVLHRESR